jgi:hypothetical protein
MPFDMSISLGDLVTASAFAITGVAGVMAIKSSVSTLSIKVDLTDKQNEERFTRIDAQVEDFKIEMKKLGDVLIELTRADGRMNLMDDRVLAQGKRLDSMTEALRELLIRKDGR